MKICVASTEQKALSSSFVKLLVEKLPYDVVYLHNGALPTMHNGQSLEVSKFNLAYLTKKIISKFSNKKLELNYRTQLGILHLLKREKVQLVYAQFGLVGAELLSICKELKIPLLVHFLGYDGTQKKILYEYKLKYIEMFDYASAILCQSNQLKQRVIELGASKNKVHFLPLGADFDLFGKEERKIPKVPVFLFAASLIERKGPLVTIAAFSKVYEKCSMAQLIMIGNGALKEECIHLAKKLKIEKAVKFVEAVKHYELVNYLRNATVLIQHSVTQKDGVTEGIPVVILEAGAMSIPVISTFHAGIPDAVEHLKTGLLVAEHDIDKTAEYMLMFVNDANLSEKMGKEAKRYIFERFNHEKTIQSVSKIIDEIIKN